MHAGGDDVNEGDGEILCTESVVVVVTEQFAIGNNVENRQDEENDAHHCEKEAEEEIVVRRGVGP